MINIQKYKIFQQILNATQHSVNRTKLIRFQYIDEILIDLVYIRFYALVKLKHEV